MKITVLIVLVCCFSMLKPVESSWWVKLRNAVEGAALSKVVSTVVDSVLLPKPDSLE
jgi:hypothetical protein